MSQSPDVVVVGGGLHGLSAALHAARRGLRVTLVEASWIGRHASGATAAGVRTLFRAWEEMPLAIGAIAMWHAMPALVGDDCGFQPGGQIRVAETEAHLEALRQREAEGRRRGFGNEEVIGADELRALVPAISPHCRGGLLARSDGSADPHRALRAFRAACESAGVTLLEGCEVQALAPLAPGGWRLRTSQGEILAGQVINCAGAWAARLAALAGETIPLGHKASMMIATERLEPFVKSVVSVQGRALSFKQTAQGTLVIGGGLQGWADVPGKRSRVDFHELAKGARAAVDLFPAVAGVRITRTWAGIEARTADLLPVIGPSSRHPGLWHAFGFSGHGFALVPVVGAVLADLVAQGQTARDIAPFRAERLQRAAA